MIQLRRDLAYSPARTSYGASFVKSSKGYDHDISSAHCITTATTVTTATATNSATADAATNTT